MFVVLPATAKLEIAPGQTFALESAALDQRDRADVGGLDVRFQSMQPQLVERVPNHKVHSGGHQTAAFKTFERIVTNEGALQRSTNDVREVDDSNQRCGLALDDDQAAMRCFRRLGEVGTEFLRAGWWTYPSTV